MTHSFIFSSESVSEGHPDKVCDFIADSILDAHLEQYPRSHVACEVLCKSNQLVLAGEITSSATIDAEQVARDAIGEIGYAEGVFQPETVTVHNFIGAQSEHIRRGVDREEMGAGDQGLVNHQLRALRKVAPPVGTVITTKADNNQQTTNTKGDNVWQK